MKSINLATISLSTSNHGNDQNNSNMNTQAQYPYPILGPWIPICFPFPGGLPIFFKGQNFGNDTTLKMNRDEMTEWKILIEGEISQKISYASSKEDIDQAVSPIVKRFPELKKQAELVYAGGSGNGSSGSGVYGLFWVGFIAGAAAATAVVTAYHYLTDDSK
ncbi:MAG: hypothetical protein Crog4KO_05710 [Crocinitomicaceae bacterium]